MSIFGSANGLDINGLPVTNLAISGAGALLSNANSNLAVPGFVISNGALTIPSPTVLNVSGTGQTLTESVTEPIVVQSAQSGSYSDTLSNVLTFPSTPTPGNLIILFVEGEGVYGTPVTSPSFTSLGNGVYYRVVQNGDTKTFTVQTISSTGTYYTSYAQAVEVSGWYNLAGLVSGTGTATQTGDVYTTSNISAPNDYLLLTWFNENPGRSSTITNVNASAPTPSGASILQQGNFYNQDGNTYQLGAVVIASIASGSGNIIGFTNSAPLTSIPSFSFAAIPYNASNAEANLSISGSANTINIQANGASDGPASTINFVNGSVAVNSGVASYTAPVSSVTNGGVAVSQISSGTNITMTNASGNLTINNTVLASNNTFAGNNAFTGAITPSTTNGIVGTTLGDNANAGSVGEYQTVTGTSTSLTSATGTALASLALTAGDWDVWGSVSFTVSTAAIYYLASCATTTSGSVSGPASNFITTAINGATKLQTGIYRITTTGTTVYINGEATFTGGTVSGLGALYARRVR